MKIYNLNKSLIMCINGRRIPKGAIYGEYNGILYYVTNINKTKIVEKRVRLENGKYDVIRTDTTRFYGYVYTIPKHRKGDARKPLDHCIWFQICLPLDLCNLLRTKFDKYNIERLEIVEFDENSSYRNNWAVINSMKPQQKLPQTDFSIRPYSQSMVDGKNWNMHEDYGYDDASPIQDETQYFYMKDNRVPKRESLKVTIKDYHPNVNTNAPKSGNGIVSRAIREDKIENGKFSAKEIMYMYKYEQGIDKIIEYFNAHPKHVILLDFDQNITRKKEFNILENAYLYPQLSDDDKKLTVTKLISYAKQFNL